MSTTTTRNFDLNAQVRADQVALLYSNAALVFALTVIGAGFLLYLYRTLAPLPLLLGWFLTLSAIASARLVLAYRYHQASPPVAATPRWEQAHLLGTALAGLTWGASAILFFPAEALIPQLLHACLFAALSLGSLAATAVRLPVFLAFTIPTLLPLSLQCFRDGGEAQTLAGIVVLGFLVWVAVWAHHLSRSLALRLEQRSALQHHMGREMPSNADPLTHLPQRAVWLDQLDQQLVQARLTGDAVSVLCLSVSGVKAVNAGLGHDAGDDIVRAIATRLREALPVSATVTRLGSTEFAVSLIATETTTQALARSLLAALNRPYQIDGHHCILWASIGLSAFPRDSDTAEPLLRCALQALHRGQQRGGNTIEVYAPIADQPAVARLDLEADLRQAVMAERLLVYYQPQIDLASGRVVGGEALVRWQHPDRGLLPPSEFIPLAEKSGLIVPLGDAVLRQACAQARTWQQSGLALSRIAVNVSARQFQQRDFAHVVAAVLTDTGLPATKLELELTESLLMENLDTAITTLETLQTLGVSISVDDFGTGYSSLAYLKRLPLDQLKIDGSFVRDCAHDPDDAAIADAVIGLARSLGLRVVAEGVETEAQLNFLQARQCDLAQGYYFGRPLPAGKFADLLRAPATLLSPAVALAHERIVLVVDDEPMSTTYVAALAEADGYRVRVAHSAAAALDILASERIGVVISDYQMPGLNGVAFLERVRRLYPNTVRILLSGESDQAVLTDSINRSAIYQFLTKPVAAEVLSNTLRQAFRLWETQRQTVVSLV